MPTSAQEGSSIRGYIVIIGSVIAFLGFITPGLYGVNYSPPAGFQPATLDFNTLANFGDGFSTINYGVYNGFTGPIDLRITFFAILASLALGFLAQKFNIDKVAGFLSYVYKPLTISSQLLSIGQLIWTIGLASANRAPIPSAITQPFIAALGGGQSAIAASHYLSVSLGLGFLIVFFGFLVGLVGVSPRIGFVVFCIFVVGFIIVLILTRIFTGIW